MSRKTNQRKLERHRRRLQKNSHRLRRERQAWFERYQQSRRDQAAAKA